MRYEVRVDGASLGVYATAEEALERVRQALEENPGHEPEIIDMETGKAYEPAVSEDEPDDLANKIGY
jgi:hypothetical protein